MLTPLRTSAQTDPEPIFEITSQPVPITIVPKNGTAKLSCSAENGEAEISYQWYLSTDGTINTGTKITDAESSDYTTETFNEKGIRYYYCVATCEGAMPVFTDVVAVAYTGLPILKVDTPENVEITSKVDWLKNTLLSLTDVDNPSWSFDNISTSIRGRGNSTWNQSKKPYALKLDKKLSIMGMPKHKRWVLIANYLDNSFIKNHLAFFLSEQFEMDYTVQGKFVDLIFNGEYRGLYWIGEAIKVDENRVDIFDGEKDMTDDQDKDYLIEMDIYYDEPVKFKSAIRQMPYMIKNDDYMVDDNNLLTSGGAKRLERLQNRITQLEQLLYPNYEEGMKTKDCFAPNETYTSILDVESWTKFWMINELMGNNELSHPKSTYFTYQTTNNLFKAGPVWDFDWASLYNQSSTTLNNVIYYDALFKSPTFIKTTRQLWNYYSSKIDTKDETEKMRSSLWTAANVDNLLWGIHLDPSNIERSDFNAYVDYVQERIDSKFVIIDDFIKNKLNLITYNLNGGTLSTPNPEVFISESTAPFTLNNPNRDGYVFAGWIGTGLDELTESVTITDDHLGDKVFTAVWQKRKDIALCEIIINDEVYTSEPIIPEIVIKDGVRPLVVDVDYMVSFLNNTNAGTATASIVGLGAYYGTLSKEFTIIKAIPSFTIPKDLSLQWNQTLADISLPNGFSFDDINATLTLGISNTVTVTFTPEDTNNYIVVKEIEVEIEVEAEPQPQPEPQPNPSTSISSISENNIKVWSYNHTIYIENAPADTKYTIIDLNGRVITTSTTKSTKEEINTNKSGIVILIINNISYKLSIN